MFSKFRLNVRHDYNDNLKIGEFLDSFEFDLEHNGKTEVIKLTNKVMEIDEYAPCKYFGYEFEEGIDENVKKMAIEQIRSSDNEDNLLSLASKCVRSLDRVHVFVDDVNTVNLFDYKIIFYREPLSNLIKIILNIIDNYIFTLYTSDKYVKELPSNISFDYGSYIKHLRKENLNEADIEDSCKTVRNMMTNIHNQTYLKNELNTTAEFRESLKDFYRFNSRYQCLAFDLIQYDHILVVDDISTNHKNTKWMLNTIRNINPTCELIVLCIGGDHDYCKMFLNN